MYEACCRIRCDSVYLTGVNRRFKENRFHHQMGRWMSTLMMEAEAFMNWRHTSTRLKGVIRQQDINLQIVNSPYNSIVNWHSAADIRKPFKAYWLRDAPASLTFNNCTLCLHCIYVFCIYLRINSDLCHLHHKMIGFYNRDKKCLQRGTDWVFK